MELQAVELLYGLGSGYFIFDIFTTVKRTEITIKGTRQSSAPIATATIVPTAWVATSTPSTRPNNAPKGSLEVSQDRTCGSSKQQTCLGSFWGDCCSRFGYCGRDNDYCTEGCQPAFGTCKNAVKQRRNTTTTDGSCGTGSGIDASCLGSRWGSCCSAFSFCGNNETYCGVGCQKQYGICLGSPVQIAGSLSEAEQSALTFLNKMQTGAIIGTVVWVLVLLLVAASYSHYRGFAAMATAVPTLKACCVVLSLGRFIAGLMLWDAALRLDGEGFCVAEKTMVGITVIWAFVPLADHCWRAML
ncbi:uncharacterized protein BDR25DRAFT_208924 [Lindgomyces ingoldianus]|uniref:Uncharacterized protein n=1 Tax=Lindgomyces ingoldianus TaxID=673940 RepID=A0ACB6RCM4_9PLEO|nr:uncharacterized protein BDR25DRAFT_208924 [Lindgomyces ingoldianus]KAF2477009.1 hypothetical protein BDR25DRAFT_208924 [Lindgomyces ingoldianus]